MTQCFKTVLSICGTENNEPVFFKHDGQRFEQPNTVKLNASTDYLVTFSVNPAREIHKLMINGEQHKLQPVVKKKETEEDEWKAYTTEFTTEGYTESRGGKRKSVQIVIEFEKGVYLKTSLQCKVYKSGETNHAHWGQRLTALDMDCKIEEGNTYVSVEEEKYL